MQWLVQYSSCTNVKFYKHSTCAVQSDMQLASQSNASLFLDEQCEHPNYVWVNQLISTRISKVGVHRVC
jgi:hypothetical protein